MLNYFHFHNGMITEPTVTEFLKWNHYTLAVLHQVTFPSSIGVPPPPPSLSVNVNVESLFQALSHHPHTCRRCRECVWSPVKRTMSAALVITALVMSDDQRVTGNNTFKEKRSQKQEVPYACWKCSCSDCYYKGLIIYFDLYVKKTTLIWEKYVSIWGFHLFDWLCRRMLLHLTATRCSVSVAVSSSFQHRRQLQHMPPQQIAAVWASISGFYFQHWLTLA